MANPAFDGFEKMRITASGNVGIRTAVPAAKLDVAGDLKVSGTIVGSLIGGFSGNTIFAGVTGGMIAGGGSTGHGNRVTDDFGTVAGGAGNRAGDNAGFTGVYGFSSNNYGVYGYGGNRGVYAVTFGATGAAGIEASAGDPGSLAGLFQGDVQVNGTFTKSSGSFKIDHPLDPANKYLYHSFVESPDMMNIYNGNVVLDDTGAGWVQLPEWFEALNRDFRYQLTSIGGFAPVYVGEEITGNRFKIAGGTPGLKVSWQVTGVRQDAYAEAHRIPVEEKKNANERGRYQYPELYG